MKYLVYLFICFFFQIFYFKRLTLSSSQRFGKRNLLKTEYCARIVMEILITVFCQTSGVRLSFRLKFGVYCHSQYLKGGQCNLPKNKRTLPLLGFSSSSLLQIHFTLFFFINFDGLAFKAPFFSFPKNPHKNHASQILFFPILISSHSCLFLCVGIFYPNINRQDMTFNSDFSQDMPHQTPYSFKNPRQNHATLSYLFWVLLSPSNPFYYLFSNLLWAAV